MPVSADVTGRGGGGGGADAADSIADANDILGNAVPLSESSVRYRGELRLSSRIDPSLLRNPEPFKNNNDRNSSLAVEWPKNHARVPISLLAAGRGAPCSLLAAVAVEEEDLNDQKKEM